MIANARGLVEPGGTTEFFLLDFSKGEGKGVSLDKKFEGEEHENILESETTTSKKFIGTAIEGSIKIYPHLPVKIRG